MSKAVKYVDRWAERVPSVCRAAKPTAWEDVSNIHAVQLTNAQYRGALLSGTFELVDAESPWVTVSGQQRLVLRFTDQQAVLESSANLSELLFTLIDGCNRHIETDREATEFIAVT